MDAKKQKKNGRKKQEKKQILFVNMKKSKKKCCQGFSDNFLKIQKEVGFLDGISVFSCFVCVVLCFTP